MCVELWTLSSHNQPMHFIIFALLKRGSVAFFKQKKKRKERYTRDQNTHTDKNRFLPLKSLPNYIPERKWPLIQTLRSVNKRIIQCIRIISESNFLFRQRLLFFTFLRQLSLPTKTSSSANRSLNNLVEIQNFQ